MSFQLALSYLRMFLIRINRPAFSQSLPFTHCPRLVSGFWFWAPGNSPQSPKQNQKLPSRFHSRTSEMSRTTWPTSLLLTLFLCVGGSIFCPTASASDEGCLGWLWSCCRRPQQCPTCPDDYCGKPMPCTCPVKCCCPDDYCAKAMPCTCPVKCCCPDDYCAKPLPCVPCCYPAWYTCGTPGSCCQPTTQGSMFPCRFSSN
jgi:hypothetical protein